MISESYREFLVELSGKVEFASGFKVNEEVLEKMVESYHHILAYAVNGKFLGVIAVNVEEGLYGRIAYVPHLYISPAERDGFVTKKLIKAVEDYARFHGAKYLVGIMRVSGRMRTKRNSVFEEYGYTPIGVSLHKEL